MEDIVFDFYRQMLRIRRFEEEVLKYFRQGLLRGTTHVCIGQEAVAVGVCAALNKKDHVFSNHRGHGHMLAKGADINKMMAEIFGKREGYARGVGGSQHMAAFDVGFMGSNGITAGGLPVAAGSALSHVLKKNEAVTVAFFGDGASAQGAFHEAANLAAVWKLPLIFVCENNLLAMGTPVEDTCPEGEILRRGLAYGMDSVTVDGNDPVAVFEAVRKAKENALNGNGPSFVEAKTNRLTGHSRSDKQHYLDDATLDEWKKIDSISLLEGKLRAFNGGEIKLQQVNEEIKREIEGAIAFAEKGKALTDEAVLDAIFSAENNSGWKSISSFRKKKISKTVSYADAIYTALESALSSDERVFLLGEDIADYEGAFKVTRNLYKKFGKDRVRNTPISENTIVGCAVGASLCGMLPVAEIMFMDFILLALDQLANHAAKFPVIFNTPVPLVVRTPAGGRRGYGATHSQCFESILLSIPGINIYCPATVQDAHDLLLEAINSPVPTVVVEHKLLYGTSGILDTSLAPLKAGKAKVCREGEDVTIITFSHMVSVALEAAEELEQKGIDAEVIDLRTIRPLDLETLGESACKTQRVIIAEEGTYTGGVGAEIAAKISEECFGYLDAPILRVAAKDSIIPTSRILEESILPNKVDIIGAVSKIIDES